MGAEEGGCGAAVRSARRGGVPGVDVVKISDGKACSGRAGTVDGVWSRYQEREARREGARTGSPHAEGLLSRTCRAGGA